jgi:hypothetical protein
MFHRVAPLRILCKFVVRDRKCLSLILGQVFRPDRWYFRNAEKHCRPHAAVAGNEPAVAVNHNWSEKTKCLNASGDLSKLPDPDAIIPGKTLKQLDAPSATSGPKAPRSNTQIGLDDE